MINLADLASKQQQAEVIFAETLPRVAEVLQIHKGVQITKQLDAVYADEDSSLDPFFVQLQAQTLSEEDNK